MSGLLLLASWNTGQNLYYVVWASVFSFVVLSAVMAPWSLSKLEVSRQTPAAVTRGEPFTHDVQLHNRKRWLPSVLLQVARDTDLAHPVACIVKIGARNATTFQVSERIDRRGVHPLPALVVRSTFPFGLFESRMVCRDEREIVVYPRVYSLRTFVKFDGHGQQMRRSFDSEGTEFFSLREYQPGDEPRRIAWRASARLGRLLVRELHQYTSKQVLVRFDTAMPSNVPNGEQVFEEIVEFAASLAVSLLNRQYTVAVETPNAFVPEGEGRAQALRILDLLARTQPADAAEAHTFSEREPGAEISAMTCLHISADPGRWGQPVSDGGGRVLHPQELSRA